MTSEFTPVNISTTDNTKDFEESLQLMRQISDSMSMYLSAEERSFHESIISECEQDIINLGNSLGKVQETIAEQWEIIDEMEYTLGSVLLDLEEAELLIEEAELSYQRTATTLNVIGGALVGCVLGGGIGSVFGAGLLSGSIGAGVGVSVGAIKSINLLQ